MTNTNLNETTNMTESNVNNQPMSYADMLRETQQEEFPLLSEVTQGVIDDPLTLMNARADEEGVVVPCALPDAMMKHLPEMISEPSVSPTAAVTIAPRRATLVKNNCLISRILPKIKGVMKIIAERFDISLNMH